MSALAKAMADSLLIRPHLPEHLVERYDAIFELAVRQAYVDDFAPQHAALEELVDADFRPLAPVIEIADYGKLHSRDVG